ncbi:MAG: helix-turn-helix transcriptional regulator [Pseudomonadota bacterium]|nr:helix-turn-helix domain-containing protein [Alphaproteobacteria bacterium]MEC7577473.1 helix-turn-helix transcriptional regulator [Pseudomonadota bacterium]MEC7701697.1 helix-turn-helix transcriptional regulator [Pseudomonadota bacterium]MEC9234839.1 helix-turn-helix transcriptional regulator [Pseudomonadota bacterium]MED5421828.1 helix-turn-helix transcriptional regulator [Pseudomonadota bacterium]
MTITAAQIRGARGLLNWSQADLSDRTGISATSIGSIENGTTTPRESTIANIKATFEYGGIEFVGLEGVKIRSGDVRVFTGRNGLISFYDTIYETLKTSENKNVVVSNVNERDFIRWLGDYAKTHINRMESIEGLNFRILIRENDDYMPGDSYAEYKRLPSDLFASVPFYAFGEKLAIMLFENEPTVIVMNYPAINAAYRIQFEDMWARAVSF